jgi:hypothetical protein
MENADECLSRSKAATDLSANGALLDSRNEIAHDRNGYVCLDQGTAHLPHRVCDVFLAQVSPAAYPGSHLTQSASKICKHGISPGTAPSKPAVHVNDSCILAANMTCFGANSMPQILLP